MRQPNNGARSGVYQKHRKKQKRSVLRRIMMTIFALMLCVGALGLSKYVSDRNQLKELADTTEKHTSIEEHTGTDTAESGETSTAESAEMEEKTLLPQYADLYQENPDLFGWIKIEDTAIDYPVMYTPDEPEKYLYANFEGNYSYCGLPFLDEECTENSDNLLIYGHNMLDGTMFRALMNYKDQSYWEAHPVIQLDTIYEEQEYEVMFAFYDRVYYKHEDVFKFYQFIDAENAQDFEYAIAAMKEKQLYDTGVTASYGDQLITLVTCSYHTENGRFVVVARKISA